MSLSNQETPLMFRVAFLLLLAASPTVLAETQTQVTTKRLADGHFELTVTLPDTTDPSAGQRAVMPAAAAACGDKMARLGKYKFDAAEKLAGAPADRDTSMVFVQEVVCGDSADAGAVDLPPPAPGQPPDAKDETLIRDRTLAYLIAKDTGDFDSGFAMLGASMKDIMGDASWRKPRAAFNAASGQPLQRQVVRVTWYDNPEGAPTPGRYAAADYNAQYANSAFYCGYVMWLLQADGNYRIVREEEGQLTSEMAAHITPGQMPNARMQLGCRD